MSRLVLIDGNAIMHRAYHALPALNNRSGEPVNAVYGFSTMLLKVINDLKPDCLAVSFDTGRPTFRQMEYLAYQSHRPKMDEELSSQFSKVFEVLEAFDIPIYTASGYEADDVIGTMAKKAEVDEVIIVTGDRDIMQLVDQKIKVYVPIRGMSEAEMFNTEKVEVKMGVKPWQIVDYKALAGDQSDNYPGVPGIGPKTACELLQKYETFEGIYKHLDDLPAGVSKKLIEGRELGQLSKKLATIVTDVPFDFNLEKCNFFLDEDEKNKIIARFQDLGFKSLVARVRGEEKVAKIKEEIKKDDSQQELF